jgi:hypothetical protein
VSAAYNPFGLLPVAHPSGIVRPSMSGGPQPYGGITIASGYSNNIFQGSPVQVDQGTPAGNLILSVAQGASSASALTATHLLIGAFQGVEYTLTATGRRTVGNFWAASTVATNIVAWASRDSGIIYEIQANGSVAATALGAQAAFTTNGSSNGNTTTGFSTVGLDTTTGGSVTQTQFNQLRIVGFSQRIDNLPGDAFTIVQVEIAAHQDRAAQLAY